jgi:hypothetical protein
MRLPHLFLVAAAVLSANAFARLPAPSDEAKAKTAEAAAKTASNSKRAAFELCKAQNKAVGDHQATMQRAGTAAPDRAVPAPAPCTDPGPLAASGSPAAAPAAAGKP